MTDERHRSGTCGEVFDRLIDDPDGAAADPIVSAHLGSCLDCFRVLTELRDGPRIAELLRRPALDAGAGGTPGPSEPDPAFWSALAARTVDAAAAVATAGGRAREPRPRAWRPWVRALGWRPGAALLGAAAAAAVIGLLGGWPSRNPAPAGRLGSSPSDATAELADGIDIDEAAGGGDISALQAPELSRLLEGLRQSEPDELSAWYGAGVDEEDGIADQIVGLDAQALRRLARALGGSTL